MKSDKKYSEIAARITCDATDRLFGVVMLGGLDDVYRVTGVNVIDDFMLVTVDDGDLAGITFDNHAGSKCPSLVRILPR